MTPTPTSTDQQDALRHVAVRRNRLAGLLYLAAMLCSVPILAIYKFGPSQGRITDRPATWSDGLLVALFGFVVVAFVVATVLRRTAPKFDLAGRVIMDADGFRHEPSALLRAWSAPRALRWDEVRGWAEKTPISSLPAHLLVFSHDEAELEPLAIAQRDGAAALREELERRSIPQIDLAEWERVRETRTRAAIERILASDFAPAARREAEAILAARPRRQGSARIDRAVLVMARGDVDALRDYVGWADADFRDVLLTARRLERGEDFTYDLLRQHVELPLYADPLVRLHDATNRGGAARRERTGITAEGVPLGEGFIAVKASRTGEVDVRVELRRRPPEIDSAEWDRVQDARIVLTSCYLVVRGGSEPWKTAKRLTAKPTAYRARIHQRVRDGRERINIALWP